MSLASGPASARRATRQPRSSISSSLSALWSGPTTGTADTLARNIEIAGDSRTVIRYLLIVSASERQQIAALATQESLAPTSGARRHAACRGPRNEAVSHAHES